MVKRAGPSALLIGAGTVLTVGAGRCHRRRRRQVDGGAQLRARRHPCRQGQGMVTAPGVATPTEAFAALDAGADALKMFPGELLPPPAVKAWRAVLPPETLLLPVGGVAPDNIAAYLKAGANGFGIGTSVYKPGMTISGNGGARQGAWPTPSGTRIDHEHQQTFGTLPDGPAPSHEIRLANGGLALKVLTHGARHPCDLHFDTGKGRGRVLGFATTEDYLGHAVYFGCVAGPLCQPHRRRPLHAGRQELSADLQ